MVDRHWLGDVALAMLLAIPTAALATSARTIHESGTRAAALSHQPAAERSPVEDRFSLFAPN